MNKTTKQLSSDYWQNFMDWLEKMRERGDTQESGRLAPDLSWPRLHRIVLRTSGGEPPPPPARLAPELIDICVSAPAVLRGGRNLKHKMLGFQSRGLVDKLKKVYKTGRSRAVVDAWPTSAFQAQGRGISTYAQWSDGGTTFLVAAWQTEIAKGMLLEACDDSKIPEPVMERLDVRLHSTLV